MKAMPLPAYLAAIKENPHLASLSLPMTAAVLAVTRPVVRELLRDKKLDGLRLTNGANWKRTVVLIASLDAYRTGRDQAFDEQTSEVAAILQRVAAVRETIAYGDLMAEIGMEWRNPPNRNRIGQILGAVSERSVAAGGFMLSALAVLKSTHVPNDSFFDLARHLKLLDDGGDQAEFLREQQEAAWQHHAGRASSGSAGRRRRAQPVAD